MPKPPLMMTGHSDIFQTPKIAVEILVPYLTPGARIWEPACGLNRISQYLAGLGYRVIPSDINEDFLVTTKSCDYIVTNPPYSIKDQFLERCYELNTPFALLLPLTALEGERRQRLYRKYGLQLLIPNKRFNFETPSGKGSGSWFATAWFTRWMELESDLTFVEI